MQTICTNWGDSNLLSDLEQFLSAIKIPKNYFSQKPYVS